MIGKPCLEADSMMPVGAGLRLENQIETNTRETSHGETLGGQSRGTGAGGGGLARIWIRVVTGTGGTRAPTGTRNAPDCGAPPGPREMAENMETCVNQD